MGRCRPILSGYVHLDEFCRRVLTRTCGVAVRPIYYTKFLHLPSLFRQIAWIVERGRRVNISPHVKPRAGKNVSTWVPWLILAAPFASFFPRTSFSPYLSIFRRGRLLQQARQEEEGRSGEGEAEVEEEEEDEEGKEEEGETCQNEMDGSFVVSAHCVKVANAASTVPSVRS